MTGIEVAAAAALGWLFNKARRAGGQLDAEVDRVQDFGLRRLHDLISRLGETPALVQVRQEAAEGRAEPSDQTRLLFVRELVEQAQRDAAFGEQLLAALAELPPGEPAPAALPAPTAPPAPVTPPPPVTPPAPTAPPAPVTPPPPTAPPAPTIPPAPTAPPRPAATSTADAPSAQDNSVRVDSNNGGVVARDITTFTFTPPPPVPPQG